MNALQLNTATLIRLIDADARWIFTDRGGNSDLIISPSSKLSAADAVALRNVLESYRRRAAGA